MANVWPFQGVCRVTEVCRDRSLSPSGGVSWPRCVVWPLQEVCRDRGVPPSGGVPRSTCAKSEVCQVRGVPSPRCAMAVSCAPPVTKPTGGPRHIGRHTSESVTKHTGRPRHIGHTSASGRQTHGETKSRRPHLLKRSATTRDDQDTSATPPPAVTKHTGRPRHIGRVNPGLGRRRIL